MLDVAANGTLVYVPGSATSRLPVWVDSREGRENPIKAPGNHQYLVPRLSPDGRRLAFHDIAGGEYDVWILDLERGTVERLTTDQGRDSEPIWSPDSTRIAYLSTGQPGGPGIFIRRADGTGNLDPTHGRGRTWPHTGRPTANGWRTSTSATGASQQPPCPR